MDLTSYEPLVTSVARRYAKNKDDLDEFEQLGRIAVWEVLEKNPDAEKAYIAVTIKNEILGYFNHQRAQKRRPENGFVSLQAPMKEGETRTIEEVIGREDRYFTPQHELTRSLIDKLKERYGRFYIARIKDSERQPVGLIRKIMRSVIEEVHGMTKEEAAQQIDYKFFIDNGLVPLLWVFYDNSPFHAVIDAFKGELVPWDFRRKPQGFWKGQKGYKRALEALEWFVNKNEIRNVEHCRHVRIEEFERDGLGGMIQRHFNSSPYLALKAVFPELKPWQTKQTPAGFFDSRDNQLDAVLNFLLSKGIPPIQELTPEETYETGIRLAVTKDAMGGAGLRGLLARHDVYDLYTRLFPEQILPWTLFGAKKPWKENPRETAANAIRWLFDKYLQIPVGEIPDYASCKLFWNVGFSGILTNRSVGFNSSPFAAVDSAYPRVFSRNDFDRHRTVLDLGTKKLKKDRK